MLKFILSTVVMFSLASCQRESPCKDVFVYESKRESNRWYGTISLRTPTNLVGVWLRIRLDHSAEQLGNWFGEASSDDNKEFLIKNPTYNLEPGPPVSLRFFVEYNPYNIVPSLVEIRLNGKVICPKSSSTNEETTERLHLSNTNTVNDNRSKATTRTTSRTTTSRPTSTRSTSSRPDYNQENNNGWQTSGHFGSSNENSDHSSSSANGFSAPNTDSHNYEVFPGDFAVIGERPAVNNPLPQSTTNKKCGTVAKRPSPLISYGQNTTPGQWPWHAALYHSNGIHLTYTCGGTLVSELYVLTAAHCVTKPQTSETISERSLVVYLGKYKLRKFDSSQDKEVTHIYVHPKYNSSLYHNDIALLKLADPVQFTDFVRPCCLWEDDVDLETVINKQGTVVGWGFDQNRKISDNLMQAQMPIVSTITCIYSNRDFFSRFTSENSFCAGFRNGTTVCNGDSGGGMVFPKQGSSSQDTVWQIRGLVSVGVALQDQGVCDPSHYIVFTDVAKHLKWIKQIMNFNNDNIS